MYPILEFESFLNPNIKDRVIKNKKPYRYLRLLPHEKPYGEMILQKVMSNRMFVMGDLHIGDPIENAGPKMEKIINSVNNTVGKDDHLLILGDLSAHTNTADLACVRNVLNEFKCRNLYLILGNNDQYDIQTYVDLGFKTVTDRLVWGNILFTHMPEPVENGVINIHGHMHEEIQYINIDWKNHINVWDNQYVPKRVQEYLDLYASGYYKGITIDEKELKEHESMKYFASEESAMSFDITIEHSNMYICEALGIVVPDLVKDAIRTGEFESCQEAMLDRVAQCTTSGDIEFLKNELSSVKGLKSFAQIMEAESLGMDQTIPVKDSGVSGFLKAGQSNYKILVHKNWLETIYASTLLAKEADIDRLMESGCNKIKTMKSVLESESRKHLYFYTLLPKGAKLSPGITTLQYQYDNDMDQFRENSDKYKDRLCGQWKIYRDKKPEELTDEEVYQGICKYRHDMTNGVNKVYLFRYPPFMDLGPSMSRLLQTKDIYEIDVYDERLDQYIVDIDWGYENSDQTQHSLSEAYYLSVEPHEYFRSYKENNGMPLFSSLNHISIIPKDGYIPKKFCKKINAPSDINDIGDHCNALMEASRSDLPDEEFGIPEERKYPLDSEKHVRSAIKLFNHCEPKYEEELARNIIKKMDKYGIKDISIGEKNRFGKYLNPVVESGIDDISFNNDIGRNFDDSYKVVKSLTKREMDEFSLGSNTYNESEYIIYREILYINNKPVAYIEVAEYPYPKMPHNTGVIAIAVNPKYRRMGLAKILCDRMLSNLSNHIVKLYWNTDPRNTSSIKLAKKMGFKKDLEFDWLYSLKIK